MAIGM